MEILNEKDKIFLEVLQEVYDNSNIEFLNTFYQHGKTTCLLHVIAVSYVSYNLAIKLEFKKNLRDIIRATLLHDYVLYDWHKDDHEGLHGFNHPYKALKNSKELFNLSKVEENIIIRHMFPLTPIPPKFKESILVSMVDKSCSLYETFKREHTYKKIRNMLSNHCSFLEIKDE